MRCDGYYQIVTKINLESLGLRLTGKAFLNFFFSHGADLAPSAGVLFFFLVRSVAVSPGRTGMKKKSFIAPVWRFFNRTAAVFSLSLSFRVLAAEVIS